MAKKFVGQRSSGRSTKRLIRALRGSDQYAVKAQRSITAKTGRLASGWFCRQPDRSVAPEARGQSRPSPPDLRSRWIPTTGSATHCERAAFDPYNGRRGGGDGSRVSRTTWQRMPSGPSTISKEGQMSFADVQAVVRTRSSRPIRTWLSLLRWCLTTCRRHHRQCPTWPASSPTSARQSR